MVEPWCFSCARNLVVIKNKRLEIVLVTSIIYPTKKETLAQVFSCELWTTTSGFRFFTVTLLKWRTTNSFWKTSDEYSLYRNSNSRSTVLVYHFLLNSINFQRIFRLVYTVYCTRITHCYLSVLLHIQYLLPRHCYCC